MDRTQLDRALDALAKTLKDLAGLNASVVLYGSAARSDWVPGRSDVNLLVLVDDISPTALRRLTPAVTAWHARGFAPPLIMGRAEWLHSADVFPIEIADMQVAHRVLCGADPVQGMSIDPADLREAVEKELRGKLMRLRQAYVRFGEAGMILGGFALASIASFFALLRCIAVLYQRQPGLEPSQTVAVLASELGGDAAVAIEIASHRRDAEWNCPPETYVRYLELVRRTVDLVDTLQNGER
ncbi:MAG: nucleotidyltransferase domain-containing protein [Gemmatimonadales bacterium]